MPVFIAAMLGALISAAGTLAGRVLIALGIGFVSYTGIGTGLDWVSGQVLGNITSLPPQAVGIAGVLQIGFAVNVLTSAYLARLTLNGLTSDTLTKMVQT